MIRRLTKHLEQALYIQECVLVPGVGAFLRHNAPASMDLSKGLIYPGHCSLSFNTAIQQSDGYLANRYAMAYGMSYRRATALLEGDVKDLREALKKNGLVQLGVIGRLTQDPRGRISFLPNSDHPFSISYYGLSPVAYLPKSKVSQIAPKRTSTDGDVVYLPINLRHIRYGAAAAVVALLILLIPTKTITYTEGIEQFQAGFLPSLSHEKYNQEAKVELANTVKHTAPQAEVQERQTISGLPVVTPSDKLPLYYVVISSLKSPDQVEKYVKRFSPRRTFPDCGILITRSGMHRVFTGIYNTAAEAQEALRQVHDHPDYSDAWVYERLPQ